MMRRSRPSRNGFAWLELLLVLAVIAMVLEIWPELGRGVLWALDVRNWPRTIWFVSNLVAVIVLLGVRLGPDLLSQWRERRLRIASECAKADKALEIKKHREALERMQESRKRRIF